MINCEQSSYKSFLRNKKINIDPCGMEVSKKDINQLLFPFQKDIVKWAVKKGRCAVFLDTGLGKTFIQLEWARLIGGTSLIVAPLSVARQTIREGKKLGLEIRYCQENSEIGPGINITNYERIDGFNQSYFDSIILDESSILKSISGKTKQKLIENFRDIKYKLCCTATPAPNDFVELGNHTAFLGVCTQQEMLAMFFINANKEHTFIYDDIIVTKKGSNLNGTEWRLKHHAEGRFFEWMAKWSITMTKPSDLGYDDDGFILPPLNVSPVFIKHQYKPQTELFFTKLHGLDDRINIRKEAIQYKLKSAVEIINSTDGQFIVWCGLDDEANSLKKELPDSVNVEGANSPEFKAKAFEDFQDGKYKVLITKPKIGAFGMNFQNASNMIFFGINDSWETYYQAIRREWRFGQKNPVNVTLLLSEYEREILTNIQRKEKQAQRLRVNMIGKLKEIEKLELEGEEYDFEKYQPETISHDGWIAMRGDSCERLKEIKDESIDLSVYSPPFADLFVYSNSDRDLGNCKNWDEFFTHYDFIIKEVFRATKPGRLSCVHTSDIPAIMRKDDFIGLRDFPGEVIRKHIENGWIFFGRAYVQKNPQVQAIRTHSSSLLFVQISKDSSKSHPGLIDQVLIFKKPGENKVPITPKQNGEMTNETWIEWAHGIWFGIRETDTLQASIARDEADEKHICPLQLGTIERCIKLYSNPGETVLTPFMGIGSEAFQAIKFGRKAIGIELKESYFRNAVENLRSIQKGLF